MRNRFLSLAVALCAALLALTALVGCDHGYTPESVKSSERKRTVRVVVGDGPTVQADARTAVPDANSFSYPDYTMTFTAQGKPEVTASLDGNAGEAQLDPGIWTLIVIGKAFDIIMIAESEPVVVTVPAEGDPITVSVTMYPVLNGGIGTFLYGLSVSSALTDVLTVLTPLDVGTAEQDEITWTIGSYHPGLDSLASGYYRLTVRAVKGTQTLIRREIVHIYPGLITRKDYVLSDADFAPARYLGGTLTGGIEGYSPVAVTAYSYPYGEEYDYRTDIGQGAVVGDEWDMEAEGTSETIYLKVKLTKDGGAGAYYSKPVMMSGVPLTKTDIVLPIEGYTVTFDAGEGSFEGGETIITMTAPENGSLPPPDAPQSDREFTGWYSAGKSFTAETRIVGDTTVYAGWLLGFDDITDYLANAQGGDTAANSIPLSLNISLANGGWENLFSAVDASGKYVSLDLAACSMAGTEFTPGAYAGADKVTGLILPDTAKSIKAGTADNPPFKAFTGLGTISGAGIETVATYVFWECDNLTSVSFPAATFIGYAAFGDCNALESMNLPAVTTIDRYAFWGCNSLTEVNMPEAVTIGNYAFYYCTSLTEVNLPSVTDIGVQAFAHCYSLTEVSLPEAETIRVGAFMNCAALESVSLPKVQTLPNCETYGALQNAIFAEYRSLTSVYLPAATFIGQGVFWYCSALTEVYLPVAASIGRQAFQGCEALESVNLPLATSIGALVFNVCEALKVIDLPAAITIGGEAFANCRALTSVSLPASLTTITGSAFSECFNLTSITVDPANTVFSARDGMLLDKTGTTLVAYPSATGDITLPFIITLGAEAFIDTAEIKWSEGIKSVSLPSATTIGGGAFAGCAALTAVSLPVATSIGAGAFSNARFSAPSSFALSRQPSGINAIISSYLYLPALILLSYHISLLK
jgi:hypothetical protein